MRAARTRRCRWILLPLLLASAGCTYFEQRLTDLHDCVLYRWHTDGIGLAVEARLGPLDAALGGWYSDYGWGKDTFWQRPGRTLTSSGIGVPFTTISPLLYGSPWTRALATSGLGNHPEAPDAFTDVRGWLAVSDVLDLDDAYPFVLTPQRRVADLFGVEVGVVPLLWGARVGVNAAEFADFVLGFAGIDLLADDGVPRPPTLPYAPDAAR